MSFTTLVLLALAQPPPSADLKPFPITGTVVDSSGSPIAFADVWLAEAISLDEGRRFGIELWWSPTTRPDEGSTPVSVHLLADAVGRFTFRVPANAVARRSPVPLAIWAASAGKEARLGWQRLPRIVLAGDPPVRIVLGAPARTDLTILSPDGKPVAAARVTPIRADHLPIRKRLTFALETTTDAKGRAVIACLTPEVLQAVRVEAQGFGEQEIEVTPSADVRLAPVARIAGRLVAPGKEPIQGVTVHATTLVGGYAGSGHRGSATVTCDAQGHFEIPAIAEGVLTLELRFDPARSLPLRGEAPKHLIAKAGRTTEVTIPLRETIEVRGLVRAKKTDQPIAGVKVVLNGRLGGDRFAVTDAAGKFSGRIVREMTQPFGWPVRIPAPFFEPAEMTLPNQRMPPRGSGELELAPMVLARGVDVQGTVVGEDNKPVAGAEVEAIWTGAEEQAWSALARTDRTGMFTLHGVEPITDLKVTAWDGFASTPEVTVRPGARPITLTISPKHTTPAGGRVVNPAGQPIAGASVQIWRQLRNKAGTVIGVDPITAGDGSVALHTGTDGRYRSQRRFPAHASYYAEVSAPGRLTARSPAIDLAEQCRTAVVLVLRGLRTIEGRVIDRQGQPVAGARVRQSGDGPLPTETLSADDGRFRLAGILEGPAFLFAEKPGYRFAFVGCSVSTAPAATAPVPIVLARTSEPPAVAYHTLPPALSIDEEKALARRLIQPYVEKVLALGKEDQKYRLFVDAAEIDPLAGIDWLRSIPFAGADYLNYARVSLTDALARENLEEATDLLEAGDSADVRAQGYAEICDLRRDLRPDQFKELLAQAEVNAKSMKSPTDRILIAARIADHWLDLGETERARSLINEALAIGRNTAKGIRNGGYNLGPVAEVSARLDLPGALKILDDLERDARQNDKSDRTQLFERFLGHIAYKLAAQSPADAELVLERISLKPTADRYVTAVSSRMAAKDLARARRIAETRISPDAPACRPHVFGLMARSIAVTDKPAAIKLIDEAYAALDQIAANGNTAAYTGVEVGAALLPIVEQIEPDQLAEFLARTLALRPSQGDPTGREGNASTWSTAALAMMIARYDRALAARLLEPELQKTGSHATAFGTDHTTYRILAALAMIDPKRAVEQVESLPDDPAPGTDPDATKNRTRIAVAKILALHGADRWRSIYQDFLYLWTPDQRYL